MAGENEQQQDQQQQQNIDQQDLDLVDDRLEDEGKDEAALWSEFDAEESGQTAATDDGTGDGGGGDDAAAAAGSDDGDAAAAGDDEGGTGSDDDSAATQQSGSAQDPDGKSDDGSKGSSSDDGRAQADQVWANATPEQRAAYDAAQTELKRLQHAERSNRGRISALQRQIAELSGGQRPSQQQQADSSRGSAEQQGQDDGAGGDQGTGDERFLNSEDWTKFREEYPEVAGPLENVIGRLESQVTRQNKELAAIGADRRENALAEQAGILAEEHSDWQEVVADDSFTEWLGAQPRHIREAAIRNAEDIVDAEEAADVVGRFKAYRAEQQGGGNAQQDNASGSQQQSGQGNGNQQARRQRQLESASTTRSRGPGVATGIPEDGDPERIWKQFDEMEKRQAGGGT